MPDFFVVFFEPSAPPNGQYQAIVGPNPDTTFTANNGLEANGLAAISSGRQGKFAAFALVPPAPFAYHVTSFVTANSNLAVIADVNGDSLVRYRLLVAGNNTALTVSVSTNDITVNVATDGSGAPTSTASQVITAINASGPAGALVTASLAPGSNGSGVVASLPWTNLQRVGYVVTMTTVHEVADSAITTF
jgi:hypothetical protein